MMDEITYPFQGANELNNHDLVYGILYQFNHCRTEVTLLREG